jgi:3-oxoadipate enol-lactonase
LHGAGGSSLGWFQQIPAFAEYFESVAIDLPGFGMSTWLGERVPIVDVLEEFILHFGWARVGVVAHSLSGWASLRLALTRPTLVEALVLTSSWAGVQLPGVLRLLEEREPKLREAQRRWREGESSSYLPGMGPRIARERPELHWLAAGISALNRGAGAAVWARDSHGKYDTLLMPETRPHEIEGWSTPTLCLAGEDDIVVPPDAIRLVAEALGNAKLQVFDQTGHSIFLQRANAFNSFTVSFLREHVVGA